jgi:hypothetical protein
MHKVISFIKQQMTHDEEEELIYPHWTRFYAKEKGKFYWVNDDTGAIVWNDPEKLGVGTLESTKKFVKGVRRLIQIQRKMASPAIVPINDFRAESKTVGGGLKRSKSINISTKDGSVMHIDREGEAFRLKAISVPRKVPLGVEFVPTDGTDGIGAMVSSLSVDSYLANYGVVPGMRLVRIGKNDVTNSSFETISLVLDSKKKKKRKLVFARPKVSTNPMAKDVVEVDVPPGPSFFRTGPIPGHQGVRIMGFGKSSLVADAGAEIGMHLVSINGNDARDMTHLEVARILEELKDQGRTLVFSRPEHAASVETETCIESAKIDGGVMVIDVSLAAGPEFCEYSKIAGRECGAKISAFREKEAGGSPVQDSGAVVGMHIISLNGMNLRGMKFGDIIEKLQLAWETSRILVYARHTKADIASASPSGRRQISTLSSDQGGKWRKNFCRPQDRYYWVNEATGDLRWEEPEGQEEKAIRKKKRRAKEKDEKKQKDGKANRKKGTGETSSTQGEEISKEDEDMGWL